MARLTHMKKVGRLFFPEYPDYPKGIVINTEIKDLRPQGVNIRPKYGGKITIELIDIKPGGYITMGSLDDRGMMQQQHVYRYRKGRKYHDVWVGMPDGVFNVNMTLNMPEEHYECIMKTNEMFEKVDVEDVAEIEIENIIENVKSIVDLGMVNDDIDEITKESTSDKSIQEQEKVKQILQEILGEDEIQKSIDDLLQLEDEKNERRKKLKEIIKEHQDPVDIRKKWARSLADIDQEIYQKTQSSTKKDSRVRKKARKDHKILKKSNTVLEEIFQVFRYYFNTHIATAKYLLNQYWLEPIPEWAADTFYSENEVIMNEIILVKEPIYSAGAMVQHSPSDHISSAQWKELQEMNFGQMCSLSTGFTAEGIFVKSFEALYDDEGEVCLILLDIGLEFVFRTLRRGLTEELKAAAEQLGIPDFDENAEGVRMSFGDIISAVESTFISHAENIGTSKTNIRRLWKHLKYIHDLRNKIIHRKNIVRSIIWEAIQNRESTYPDPVDFDIAIEKDFENRIHKKPYWWRLLSTLWQSSMEINQLVIIFKARFLTSDTINDVSSPRSQNENDGILSIILRRIRRSEN